MPLKGLADAFDRAVAGVQRHPDRLRIVRRDLLVPLIALFPVRPILLELLPPFGLSSLQWLGRAAHVRRLFRRARPDWSDPQGETFLPVAIHIRLDGG